MHETVDKIKAAAAMVQNMVSTDDDVRYNDMALFFIAGLLYEGIERVRDIDERIRQIKARRTDGRTVEFVGEYGAGSSSERYNHPAEGQRDTDTAAATERIAELMREAEQREQSRERASIKE